MALAQRRAMESPSTPRSPAARTSVGSPATPNFLHSACTRNDVAALREALATGDGAKVHSPGDGGWQLIHAAARANASEAAAYLLVRATEAAARRGTDDCGRANDARTSATASHALHLTRSARAQELGADVDARSNVRLAALRAASACGSRTHAMLLVVLHPHFRDVGRPCTAVRATATSR